MQTKNKNNIIAVISLILFIFLISTIILTVNSQNPATQKNAAKKREEKTTTASVEDTFTFVHRYQLDYSIGEMATDKAFKEIVKAVLKNQSVDSSEPKIKLVLDESSIKNLSTKEYFAYSFNFNVESNNYFGIIQTDTLFGQEYVLIITTDLVSDKTYLSIVSDKLDQTAKDQKIEQAKIIYNINNPEILN
jgi:hypothetical protein